MADDAVDAKQVQEAQKTVDTLVKRVEASLKAVAAARKESVEVNALIDGAMAKAKGVNVSARSLRGDWAKQAKELGAAEASVKALAVLDSGASRDSVSSALKAISKDASIRDIAMSLAKIIQADNDATKKLEALAAEVDKQKAAAAKVASSLGALATVSKKL